MVEGPKVNLKAERLQILVGQCVGSIEIAMLDGKTFEGRRIIEIFNVGKELFILFEDITDALRLHFGMNGSERIVKTSSNSIPAPPGRKKLSGIIKMSVHSVVFFDTSLSIRKLTYVSKIRALLNCDVMSDVFEIRTPLEVLKNDKRPVHESIMDQLILPGVGMRISLFEPHCQLGLHLNSL